MIHLYGREYQAPHRQCFPKKSKRKRREIPTDRDISVFPLCLSAPQKTGERKRTVKGLPARDGKKFYRNRHLCFSFKIS